MSEIAGRSSGNPQRSAEHLDDYNTRHKKLQAVGGGLGQSLKGRASPPEPVARFARFELIDFSTSALTERRASNQELDPGQGENTICSKSNKAGSAIKLLT